jgi:hypothetical protein
MRRLVLLRAKVHDDDEGHHGKHHQHQRAARRVLLLAFTAVQHPLAGWALAAWLSQISDFETPEHQICMQHLEFTYASK